MQQINHIWLPLFLPQSLLNDGKGISFKEKKKKVQIHKAKVKNKMKDKTKTRREYNN